ncbi:3-deoxy-D-manno-octulosonic acid transferase [Pseudomonas amygdali]
MSLRNINKFTPGLCFGLCIAFYQLVLTVLLPVLLWQARRTRAGECEPERERLKQRLLGKGLFKWQNRRVDQQGAVLIHAVSLGEAKVAWELAKRLDRSRYRVFITVTTLSGYQYLASMFGNTKDVRYMPLDWLPFMLGLLRALKVRKIYVIEHDIWPGLLLCARILKIPALLINGHFSKSSMSAYKKTSYLSAVMLNMFTEIHLQHKHELNELSNIGVRPEKMSVTGSLKLLTSSDTVQSHAADRFQLCFGSCHDVEFTYLATLAAEIRRSRPACRILFVPRHPDDAQLLVQALKAQGLQPLFTKEFEEAMAVTDDVVVLAQFGTLLKAYNQSLVGVVCGSFDPSLKGHNLLEPLQCGAVSLHGPYIEAQLDIAIFMKTYGMEGQGYIGDSLLERLYFYLDAPATRNEVVDRYPKAIAARKKEMEHYFSLLRNN